MKEVFINAIQSKAVVQVTFNSKEKGMLTRKCIPFDIVPSDKSKDGKERFNFYNLDGKHNLSLIREQVMAIELTKESFKPNNYITWSQIDWFIKRDWEMDW